MKPAKTLLLKTARLGGGIMTEHCGFAHVPPLQAYAPAVLQVDCG
jgi:hypothetical protein